LESGQVAPPGNTPPPTHLFEGEFSPNYSSSDPQEGREGKKKKRGKGKGGRDTCLGYTHYLVTILQGN